MKYSHAQLEAIHHMAGPCLVLAVPGAGKTTVLLERIRYLVSQGIEPSQIFSITFSRQQALDMRTRFIAQNSTIPTPHFATIHAFCYQILREYAKEKRQPISVLEAHPQYKKSLVLAELFEREVHRPITEEEVESFFRIDGYLKNAMVRYADYTRLYPQSFPAFESIQRQYQLWKAKHHLIDFDDMLVFCARLFAKEDPILTRYRDRFPYIQVDEAQDVSALQFAIVQALALPNNNLFLVADDDQSIYGFRGAQPSHLLSFERIYPGAKKITMDHNHRSGRHIVENSTRFIDQNKIRFPKQAVAQPMKAAHKIQVLFVKSLRAQCQALQKNLLKIPKDESIAILYRNHISLYPIVHALDRKHLTFQTRSAQLRFFRQPLLRDLRALLHLIADPTDLSSFQQIYYKVNHYFKKSFLEELAWMDPHRSIYDRLRDCGGTQNHFYRQEIEAMEEDFSYMASLPISAQLRYLDQKAGYGDYLKEKARKEGAALHAARRAFECLEYLSEGCKTEWEWEKRLEAVQTLSQSQESSSITLSTVHAAKGLEFDHVFVVDLLQGEFPSNGALLAQDRGQHALMEEERRLFYVAMTRAKKHLTLIGRQQILDQSVPSSQFIEELVHPVKNRKRKNKS